jgi:hypothetical protein
LPALRDDPVMNNKRCRGPKRRATMRLRTGRCQPAVVGGWLLLALLAGLGHALAGCTTLHPEQLRPGQNQAQVRAAMGEPADRYPLAYGGQRLAYPLGPAGLQTWLVDLDAQGQVSAVLPALTPERFAQVQPGMAEQDLLRWLGRPAHRQREWQDKETWSWRFDNPLCLWARVTLSAAGVVTGEPSFPSDPRCERPERGGLGGARH